MLPVVKLIELVIHYIAIGERKFITPEEYFLPPFPVA